MAIDYSQIRANADIVKVISSYIPLQRKGKNFVGICPFHDDTSPSMFVSPDKQIYKCFACGAAGNVFTFVQNYENIDFIDAVKKVCELSGQHVEELAKTKSSRNVDPEKEVLYKIFEDLTKYYMYVLHSSEGKDAMNYLANRNIDDAIIEEFQIGFSPVDPQISIKFLQNKGYKNDDIIKAGIGAFRNGEVYDMYSGRVIFPLCDMYGRVIGYSGRKINNDPNEPKYRNTNESLIFHKSDVLYHYHKADKTARKDGYVYVLEGFMDVIALSKIGIKSAVAIMGTALTQEHLRMLKKLNCEIRLSLDGDLPGQMATYKNLQLFGELYNKVKIVNKNLDSKDADEILATQGSEALYNSLQNTSHPLDFAINYLQNNFNLNNYEDKQRFVISMESVFSAFKLDELTFDYYSRKISNLTGFSLNVVQDILKKKKQVNKINVSNIRQEKAIANYNLKLNKYERIEKIYLQYMLKDNKYIKIFNEDIGYMQNQAYRRILAIINDYYRKSGKVMEADLYSNQELNKEKDPQTYVFFQDLMDNDEIGYDVDKLPREDFKRILTEQKVIEQNEKNVINQLRMSGTEDEQTKLLLKQIELKKQRQKCKK